MMINGYQDFVEALLAAGFSANGAGKDICSVFRRDEEGEPVFGPAIQWHTGDSETDPWEWRVRVLEDRDDIAYGKVFFKLGGFITREWYPYFLAVRRQGRSLQEAYERGEISAYAKRVYEGITEAGELASHEIRPACGFGRTEAGRVERALTELQMGLYITICGRKRRFSLKSGEYGWSSTVFCAAERFFPEALEKALQLTPWEATEAITERIYALNPAAWPKGVAGFVKG